MNMIRFTTLLVLSCSIAFSGAFAADSPASEASIKKLLEVSRVRQILDGTMAQVDTMMNQMTQQLTQGQPVSPKVQKDIDAARSDAHALVKEILDWNKLEAMYVRIYQKSFTQQEIDGLIAMYQTPTGQALLSKMPAVMQNTMAEMGELMKPLMDRLERKQQELAAEIRKSKTGG